MDHSRKKTSEKSSGPMKRRRQPLEPNGNVGNPSPQEESLAEYLPSQPLRDMSPQSLQQGGPFSQYQPRYPQPSQHPFMINTSASGRLPGPRVFMQHQPFGNSDTFRLDNIPRLPLSPAGHFPSCGHYRGGFEQSHSHNHNGVKKDGSSQRDGGGKSRPHRRDQGARPKTWRHSASDRKKHSRGSQSAGKKNSNNSSNANKADDDGRVGLDETSDLGHENTFIHPAGDVVEASVSTLSECNSAASTSGVDCVGEPHRISPDQDLVVEGAVGGVGRAVEAVAEGLERDIAGRGAENNTHCDKNLIDEGAVCDFDRLFQSQELYRLSGRRRRFGELDDDMERDEGAADVGAADLSDSELENFDYFLEDDEAVSLSRSNTQFSDSSGACASRSVQDTVTTLPMTRLGCDPCDDSGDNGSDAGDFIDTDLPLNNKHLLSSSEEAGDSSSASSDNDLDAGGLSGQANGVSESSPSSTNSGQHVSVCSRGSDVCGAGNISPNSNVVRSPERSVASPQRGETFNSKDSSVPCSGDGIINTTRHQLAALSVGGEEASGFAASQPHRVNDLNNTSLDSMQMLAAGGEPFSNSDSQCVDFQQNVYDDEYENVNQSTGDESAEKNSSPSNVQDADSENGASSEECLHIVVGDDGVRPAPDADDAMAGSPGDNVDRILLPMEEEIEPVHLGPVYIGGGCVHDAGGRAACASSSFGNVSLPFGNGMPSKEFYDLIKTVSTTDTCMRFFDKDGLDIQRQPVAAAIGQFDEDDEEGEASGGGVGKSERLKVDRVMIWNEYEAYIMQFKQIAVSACGQTAVLNVLKALNIPCEKADVVKAIKTNLRKEDADIPQYLFSRACAGTTAEELMAGVDKLSQGKVGGRFFHFWPPRKVQLLKWLAYWMNKGAIPVATLNLQQGPHSLWQVPDSWHHQMVYGVSPQGLYLTNPLEIVSERTAMRQVCSDSVLKVRRQDVISRFRDSTDLRQLLTHPDPRWRTMNVMGQVINVLREFNMPSVPGYRLQVTSHISLPAAYKAGVTLFMAKESQAWSSLMKAPELAVDGTQSKKSLAA